MGAFQAPANALAVAIGGHVRVGLEDNPWLDGAGAQPATNVRLVERATSMAAILGRPIATPPQARSILGLPPCALSASGHGDERRQ
jgi:uncharacterized protein (DUF849 family)